MAGRFRVSAKAVIIVGGQVLLTRTPSKMWELPGGKLQPREAPEAGLVREVEEELRIAIDVGDVLDCAVRPKQRDLDVMMVAYLCSTTTPLDRLKLSREHTRASLFPAWEIASLKMNKVYKRAIDRGFARVGAAAFDSALESRRFGENAIALFRKRHLPR